MSTHTSHKDTRTARAETIERRKLRAVKYAHTGPIATTPAPMPARAHVALTALFNARTGYAL